MASPVVHFEIIGPDPDRLRAYYADLFGWTAPAGAPVSSEISDVDRYSFLDTVATPDGVGIPGGIGGGPNRHPHTIFYVGVADVGQALEQAERLGGTRILGPVRNEGAAVVVAHFTDPAGNLVGLAGPA